MWTTVWVIFDSILCFILGIAAYALVIQLQKADDAKLKKDNLDDYATSRKLNSIDKHIAIHNLIQFTEYLRDSSLSIRRRRLYFENGDSYSLYDCYINSDDERIIIIPDSLELNKDCEKIYASYLEHKSEVKIDYEYKMTS